MNGNKLFVDTNIILYLLSGDETLAELLNDKQIHISFITQLELLGYKNLNEKDQTIILDFLSECIIIDINSRIKSEVINIRKKYNLKLPDCIIAATAIYLDLPLITADIEMKKIVELNLVLYEQ